MKYIVFILFVGFFFNGCRYHYLTLQEIDEKRKQLTKSEYSDILTYTWYPNNKDDEQVVEDLNNILKDIQGYYFDTNKQLNTKLILINLPQKTMKVLPNENIIVFRGIVEEIKYTSVFNFNNEIKAVMCHEFAHILNDDWGYKIQKNNNHILIDYNITTFQDQISVDKDGKVLFDKFTFNNNFDQKATIKADKDGKIPLILKHYFSLETEINADILTLDCLQGLGVQGENATNALLNAFRILSEFHSDKKADLNLKARKENLQQLRNQL